MADRFLLEDGSGYYLLEDGSGYFLTEIDGSAWAAVTGVEMSFSGRTAVDSVTAAASSPDGTATPAGVEMNFAVGAVGGFGGAAYTPSGVEIAFALGTPEVLGGATYDVGGIDLAFAVGDVTASGQAGDATIAVTGVELAFAIGQVTAAGTAEETGVGGFGRIGIDPRRMHLAWGANAVAHVTGVGLRLEIGTVTATGGAVAGSDVEAVEITDDELVLILLAAVA